MGLQFPQDKFMSTVKVGDKGQIVIPKGAREMFNIQPGDTLLLLADKKQGIALVEYSGMEEFARQIFRVKTEMEEEPE